MTGVHSALTESRTGESIDKDLLLAEWQEIRESLRYFGTKRFTQLAVFMTANGFLVNAVFAKEHPLPMLIGGSIGALITVVFFLHEVSSVAYFKRFAARGRQIECLLGHIRLMHRRPRSDLGTHSTYLLYCITFVAWILASGIGPRVLNVAELTLTK